MTVGDRVITGADRSPQVSFEARQPARGGVAVDRLRQLVADRVLAGYPPGLSLAVVDETGVVVEAFGGYACVVDELVEVSESTRFDLASLTKVVCTVTLTMIAAERGLLGLEDRVVRHLEQFPGPDTTLLHLLTHTSGLVDHQPFFATRSGRGAIESAVFAEASGARAASPVLYSDLNFMLLGWILEAVFAAPLDEVFTREVAVPLGLERTGFRPSPAVQRETAATELDGDQRRVPGLVWGEVHDGNAWALGGVAGHAGLFATVGELARFARTLFSGEGLLSPMSLELVRTEHAESAGDRRGIGWRLRPEGWGSWPPGTFWHTGFTGTSLLISPEAGIGVVLLANGVHPRRRPAEQAAFRAEVHEAIARACA